MKNIITILFFLSFGTWAQTNLEFKPTTQSENKLEVIESSDHYYNLGVDYFHKKELGEAIWAFNKAIVVYPNNKDAYHNLNVTKSALDLTYDTPKDLSYWLSSNLFNVNPNFWFYLSVGMCILMMVFLFIFLIPTSQKMNNISLFMSSVCGVILVSSFIISVQHKSHLTQPHKAVIINFKSNLLSEPFLGAETVSTFKEGNELNLVSSQDDWFLLELNQEKGWVLKDSVWIY